ncbi:hypothetical protein BPP43_05780 [Brachyspira pilosicoli P43/6/78]|uniref:Uncharacterized protein n=1 Tax=Brachyspira pilosicoli P43/6/78 TaxID=1042417 RepID=A0A3B6VKK9_BRAPL|nr:hypothetical protein BPP43_05780 [Brachyspira pilosicoli P43/6/78]
METYPFTEGSSICSIFIDLKIGPSLVITEHTNVFYYFL